VKIAFIVDKTQTFQIIAKVLKTALIRAHSCDVYCCFNKAQLKYMGDYYGELKKQINWISNSNRNALISHLVKNRKKYDAVIGINFFNRSLRPIFDNKDGTSYGLEYCWNEVYNSAEARATKFQSTGVLFCNNPKTQKIISQIFNFKNLEYLGSPWYEYINECKTSKKSDKIVFMVPHQSFYNREPGLSRYVSSFLDILKTYCNNKGFKLVLKTRSKYSTNYKNEEVNTIISDDQLCSHIETYKNAKIVINFCSSAINELTYLQVPFLVIGTKIQKNLHPSMKCDEGIKHLHENYYSGRIFDKVHCENIEINENLTYESLESTLNILINSSKKWPEFQKDFFCASFVGASERIIRRIEEDGIKKNTTD
jgi:hypothetical protein